jgi:hypothetical protein
MVITVVMILLFDSESLSYFSTFVSCPIAHETTTLKNHIPLGNELNSIRLTSKTKP